MKVYCNNKAATSIAHNMVLDDRTNHVEVDQHFIREKLNNGLIFMPYIPTTDQISDIFTKGLHKKQFDSLIGQMTMEDIFKPAWGGVLTVDKWKICLGYCRILRDLVAVSFCKHSFSQLQ